MFKTVLLIIALFLGSSDLHASTSSRETPVVKVVKNNSGSVVNISTEKIIYLRERPYWGYYDNEFDSFFDRFYGHTYAFKSKSVGSGVIIDKGLVVTNAHVVEMASNIYVILNDGKKLEAKVVYKNLDEDVALVKFKPVENIKAIKLGKSDDVMIGETAIAIGNPLGFENSVTVGVISGKNREFHSSQGDKLFSGLIQTDAPINPGNSGGALLNLDGELIGINVAVVYNSQSLGFAIPVEKVKQAKESYVSNKKISVSKRKTNREAQLDSGIDPGLQHPMSHFEKMRDWMSQMMQDSFGSWDNDSNTGIFGGDFSYDSNLDIEDKGSEYIIKIDVNNIDQQNLKVEINGQSLSVSGQTSSKTENSSSGNSFYSQSYGSFYKMVPLPADADVESITTETKNDILYIKLKKK